MAIDFSALKKNSSLESTSLVKKIEQEKTSFKEDERFWTCQRDKSGSGFAVVRFLPPVAGEEYPWVKYYRHAFKGPTGKWYIENSLTSLNLPDPVGDLNAKLWNTGLESDKEIARGRSRNKTYVSNIYVISDPTNPENEGKVFLYRYGQKIFNKIQSALQPEFKDEIPINVFSFWEGANFKLKIKTENKQVNYDSSMFESQSALFDDDAKLEAIWKQEYPLLEFIDPKSFKTYEELKKRLDLVINESSEDDGNHTIKEAPKKPTKYGVNFDDDDIPDEPVKAKPVVEEKDEPPFEVDEKPTKPSKAPTPDDDDDEDITDYFSNLGKK